MLLLLMVAKGNAPPLILLSPSLSLPLSICFYFAISLNSKVFFVFHLEFEDLWNY